MVYLITYDLNKEKNYPLVYEAIKSLGEVYRDTGLDSVWFVSTDLNIDFAKDVLVKVIDKNDRLFITEIKVGEYSGWMHRPTWDWLQKNI